METDSLIKALAADTTKPALPQPWAWAAAIGLAVLLAAAVFLALLGPRPDIGAVAGTARFLFKFAFTLAVSATAFGLLRALARPGAPLGKVKGWILLAPVLMAGAVSLELALVPSGSWAVRMMGTNSLACLGFIPLIGLGPLAVFMAMLRHGAPTRPRLAGAVAGVLAGGLSATFYAAHCTDDSPLFVGLWYSLAIAGLAVLGSLAAPRMTRW